MMLEIELGTDPFFFLKTTVRQLKEKLGLFSELNKIIDDHVTILNNDSIDKKFIYVVVLII